MKFDVLFKECRSSLRLTAGLRLLSYTGLGTLSGKVIPIGSRFQLLKFYRQIFHPEYDLGVLPAHCYPRGVHNISIEHAWLRLRLDFGNNTVLEKLEYEKGALS